MCVRERVRVRRSFPLTPAAGRASQQLAGPRVVDGVLPAGRGLLADRLVLGACHDAALEKGFVF